MRKIADSDEVARRFRDDVARRSEMMSPGWRRGLAPLDQELGIHVCGGRGRYSRQTPHELVDIGDRVGFDGAALATASRLVAKVDSAAVQDGFQLYLHGFIVTDDGPLGGCTGRLSGETGCCPHNRTC